LHSHSWPLRLLGDSPTASFYPCCIVAFFHFRFRSRQTHPHTSVVILATIVEFFLCFFVLNRSPTGPLADTSLFSPSPLSGSAAPAWVECLFLDIAVSRTPLDHLLWKAALVLRSHHPYGPFLGLPTFIVIPSRYPQIVGKLGLVFISVARRPRSDPRGGRAALGLLKLERISLFWTV